MKKTGTSLLLLLLLSNAAWAVPNSLSYQGRIVKPDGSAFEGASVSFLFEITNPSGNCVVYREQKSGVNLTNSNGIFDVPIGTGSKLFPLSPTKTLLSIFDNSQALDCGDTSNNVASTYTPSLNQSRLLRVQFHDGTGWQLITPDTEIRSVPFAAYASGADTAQSLSGKSVSDFILKASIPTCGANSFLSWNGSVLACTSISSLTLAGDVSGSSAATTVDKIKGVAIDSTAPTTGQVLKFDGSKWAPATDATGGGGTGTVTSVSGTAGQITVTNGSTTPVLALENVGTAGTYYKVTTDVHGRVTSGVATLSAADIPALDYSKITTGAPNTLTGYGITDAVRNQGGTPGIKSGLNASKGSASSAGNLYISTDTKEIYRDNGTTWDLLGSSMGGTLTGVTAGTGLTGGGTSGAVTLNVNVGTSANQIVQLDGSSKLPAVDGSALTNLNPSALSAVVPIAKGGTGQSSATAGFNALSPLTAKGDLLTRDSSNNTRLPAGSDGQVLSSDSSQTAGLKWITPNAGTVTNVTATSPLSVATGGTTPAISISVGSGNAQVLRWNTTNWSASYFNFTDLKSAAGLAQIPNNCTSSQTLVWQSIPDTFACTTIAITGTNFGAQTAGLVFAGPTTGSANPTFRALASTDLPSGTLQGSGTAGYIPYYSATTTLANSPLYTTSSNIGVGTTSPGYPLHIETARAGSMMKIKNSTNTGWSSILFNDSTETVTGNIGIGNLSATSWAGSVYLSSTSASPLSLGTNNTERVRIDSNGKVGIGTTSPTAPLTVFGGALIGDKSTFPSDFSSIETNTYTNSLYKNTATSGTFGAFGSWMRAAPASNSTLASQALSAGLSFDVPAGVTVTSNSEALWMASTRNRYSGNSDNGTVTSLRGATIIYGHENTVPANTPFTTNAYGIVINPATATGTITNMYDLYLGTKSAGATVTNRYGLYQSDSSASNVFLGPVGIGASNAISLLNVQKDQNADTITNIANLNSGASARAGISLNSDAATGALLATSSTFNVFGNMGDAVTLIANSNASNGLILFSQNGINLRTDVNDPTLGLTVKNGSVGIGTTAPQGQLHVVVNAPTSYGIIKNENTATGGQAWRWLSSATSAPLGADAMCFGLNTCLFTLRTTGNATLAGTLTQSSDLRLKKDIQKIPDSLKRIEQLRGVSYHWIDPTRDPVTQLGVIAQEVEPVFPELVRTDNQGIKSVNYLGFIAPVINAIKELHALFGQQSREIASLKEENLRLKNNEQSQEQRLRDLEQRLQAIERASAK